MSDRGAPDYQPPAPDETLRQWLSSTSADWMVSQPTLWLPAIPPDPTAPIVAGASAASTDGVDRPAVHPSIPRQRTRPSSRRNADVGSPRRTTPSRHRSRPGSSTATDDAAVGADAVPPGPTSGYALVLAVALLLVVAVTLAISLG